MDLNIRNVPEELCQAVRVRAAQEGVTIREYVQRVLERQVMPNAGVGRESSQNHDQRTKRAVTGDSPSGKRESEGNVKLAQETVSRIVHRLETASSVNPSKIGKGHAANCSCLRCKPLKREKP